MLRLRIGRSYILLQQTGDYLIGRAPSCQVSLDDAGVSRSHARITVAANGEVSAVDLGSRNGTVINGQPTRPGSPRTLVAGDVIAVGAHVLHVESCANAAEPEFVTDVRARPVLALEPRGRGADGSDNIAQALATVRSCPVCREVNPRNAKTCQRCRLDFTDTDAVELYEFTGSHPTLRQPAVAARLSAVAVVSPDNTFLRALKPAFTVSDDLVLGSGRTVEEALSCLDVAPALILFSTEPLDPTLNVRPHREKLAVPCALFGLREDNEGQALAARVGADAFIRQSASAILFVARVRLCLARLKRAARPELRSRAAERSFAGPSRESP